MANFKEQMIPRWVSAFKIKPTAVTFWGNQQYWMPKGPDFLSSNQDEYNVTSYAQISDVCHHVMHVFDTVLFPLFEKAKTVQGLDGLMNQWNEFSEEAKLPFKPHIRWFDNLYVAYLAKNPRLEFYIDLFDKMINARKNRGGIIDLEEQAVFSLIDYMRTNPLSA